MALGSLVAALRPHLRSAPLFVTGDWQTSASMVRAIRGDEADGIGITGVNAAAEPGLLMTIAVGGPTDAASADLPRKLLNDSVRSIAYSPFADDPHLAALAARTQLAQMGSLSLRDAGGDPLHAISDFSDDAQAAEFRVALDFWRRGGETRGRRRRSLSASFRRRARSQPPPSASATATAAALGILEFKTRHRDVIGGPKNVPREKAFMV